MQKKIKTGPKLLPSSRFTSIVNTYLYLMAAGAVQLCC